MATGGWSGYGSPVLLEQAAGVAARRRGTVWDRACAQAEAGTERQLQRAVETILGQMQAAGQIRCWYHRPDRATRAQDREQRGLPDLVIGVREGLVVALELKTATGKVSQEQAEWLACWGERGRVCRGVGEVLGFLREVTDAE